MQRAVQLLRHYEIVCRELEFVRPAVKYDNRAVAAHGLALWVTARNTPEKIEMVRPGLPVSTPELRAEAYTAAVERRQGFGREGRP
jgi:hypothetical protein